MTGRKQPCVRWVGEQVQTRGEVALLDRDGELYRAEAEGTVVQVDAGNGLGVSVETGESGRQFFFYDQVVASSGPGLPGEGAWLG